MTDNGMSDRTSYAKALIDRLKYMTLATTSHEGQPWNSPVSFAYDDALTFYWGSRLNAQHSINIAQDDRGFIVIYDSTVPYYHGEAFYAQVQCERLGDTEELDKAIGLLHQRVGKPYMKRDEMLGPERGVYRARIQMAWIKDLERDIRHEVQLTDDM